MLKFLCWQTLDTNKKMPETGDALTEIILSGTKVGSFSKKNIKKKHLCRHDKNYCYFCKSNIPVIDLILDSRNMIKEKNMSFKKYEFSKN